jgi:glutamate-1-semialdehyde 2,1-aminomutase
MAFAVPMREIDHEIWQRELDDFVPQKIHDAHVHVFRTEFDTATTPEGAAMSRHAAERGFADTTMALWQQWNAALVPGREVHGSCMGFPFPKVDLEAMNQFVVDEARKDAGSVPFMIVRPGLDPQEMAAFIEENGVVGLKPYRFYSSTGDPVECGITDFLPEELIEVANEYGSIVILHMSKSRAAADPQNLADLKRFNSQYPRVKWQLAHCARCFIPSFLEESIDRLTELENIWYDTSAVCESDVFDVLFSRGARERIQFGTDNLPAGVDRGKYIAFGYAWATLTETNHGFNLSHCNPSPTWVIYEQLRAMRRIAIRYNLIQTDIEDLFYNNAMRLLGTVGK